MNEKSNPMPMMYKTIPAVAELNKVQGFDPLKFLRHKVSRKTNEEMLQLELPYQKLWFRLRHPQGRMKLTTLRITEQLAIMEARVYLDRSDAEPISSYISQHSAEEGTDYVQAAQDEALSAALSDAGFGLQFADVAVDSTGKVFGSSIPLSGTAPIQQAEPALVPDSRHMAAMCRMICAISGQKIISVTLMPRKTMRMRRSLFPSRMLGSPLQRANPRRWQRRKRRNPRRHPSRRKKSLLRMGRCRCWILGWQRQAEPAKEEK